MKIIGNVVYFKSSGQNYYKERDNHKCNTIRRFENWEELKAFQEFESEFNFNNPNKSIHIDGGTEGWFERTITDITKYEGYYIISWRPI